jgi:hypothetical protein
VVREWGWQTDYIHDRVGKPAKLLKSSPRRDVWVVETGGLEKGWSGKHHVFSAAYKGRMRRQRIEKQAEKYWKCDGVQWSPITMEGHATIFSREWWITVFLVGLGIHLLASYLKPRLDQIGGWFSRSWANRNEVRAKARQKRIETFKRSRMAQANATTEEFRAHLAGLERMGLALLLFVLFTVIAIVFPHSQPNRLDLAIAIGGSNCCLSFIKRIFEGQLPLHWDARGRETKTWGREKATWSGDEWNIVGPRNRG